MYAYVRVWFCACMCVCTDLRFALGLFALLVFVIFAALVLLFLGFACFSFRDNANRLHTQAYLKSQTAKQQIRTQRQQTNTTQPTWGLSSLLSFSLSVFFRPRWPALPFSSLSCASCCFCSFSFSSVSAAVVTLMSLRFCFLPCLSFLAGAVLNGFETAAFFFSFSFAHALLLRFFCFASARFLHAHNHFEHNDKQHTYR